MIEELNDYVVDKVCCGHFHSYFRTNCGKHFMCGSNDDNECMIEDEGDLFRAKRIDLIIKGWEWMYKDSNTAYVGE